MNQQDEVIETKDQGEVIFGYIFLPVTVAVLARLLAAWCPDDQEMQGLISVRRDRLRGRDALCLYAPQVRLEGALQETVQEDQGKEDDG